VPDHGQPVAQARQAAGGARRRADPVAHGLALLQHDHGNARMVEQDHQVQQVLVRLVRQAEQQRHLGARVTGDGDHHHAAEPAHGIGPGGRLDGEETQAW
jgi:hypothetical protein